MEFPKQVKSIQDFVYVYVQRDFVKLSANRFNYYLESMQLLSASHAKIVRKTADAFAAAFLLFVAEKNVEGRAEQHLTKLLLVLLVISHKIDSRTTRGDLASFPQFILSVPFI